MAESTHTFNRQRGEAVIDLVKRCLRPGGKAAMLGLSYKPSTDVIEESPSISIVRSLAAQGVEVIVYDPAAMDRARQELGDCVTYAASLKDCLQTIHTLRAVNEDQRARIAGLRRELDEYRQRAERAEIARLDVRQHRRKIEEGKIDATGQEIGGRGGRSAVGDMHQLEAAGLLKLQAEQLRNAALSDRSKIHRAVGGAGRSEDFRRASLQIGSVSSMIHRRDDRPSFPFAPLVS